MQEGSNTRAVNKKIKYRSQTRKTQNDGRSRLMPIVARSWAKNEANSGYAIEIGEPPVPAHGGCHRTATRWGQGERRWGLQTMNRGCCKRLAEDALDFEARRISLAPTVPVGESSGTLCGPNLVHGTTRSVEDGIPTQERGNESPEGEPEPRPLAWSVFPTPFTSVNRCSKSIPKTAISAILGDLRRGLRAARLARQHVAES
jgi:hypothetical protein